jgi:hypothetical protein
VETCPADISGELSDKIQRACLDAYHTLNTRLLLDRPQAPSTGFFSVMDNVGKVRNMGLELAADGSIFRNRDWNVTMGFNLGLNQNRVVELPDHADMPLTRAEVTQLVREGQQIYSWYMPKWMGVNVENGKPQWEHIITQEELDARKKRIMEFDFTESKENKENA